MLVGDSRNRKERQMRGNGRKGRISIIQKTKGNDAVAAAEPGRRMSW